MAARQLLRAVRGKRSQVAFSRRLGFRGNAVAQWESGRRFPTASQTLRACARVGIDVKAAVERFHPGAASALVGLGDSDIAAWLDALRGSTGAAELAKQVGCSRHTVQRWLTGGTRPRLPDFLTIVNAITGRVAEWVAEIVPIDAVPALAPSYHRLSASRELAFEEPWSELILRIIETVPQGRSFHPQSFSDWLAERIGVEVAEADRCLNRMKRAGVIRWDGAARAFRAAAPLTVDTRSPERARRLKRHWIECARQRLDTEGHNDLFGYNVMSLARGDLDRVRQLLLATYREIRTIVAASQPEETVALVNVQLIEW